MKYFFSYELPKTNGLSEIIMNMSDITIDIEKNEIIYHRKPKEKWKITLVNTGEHSMTGGRLKRVSDYLKGEDAFFFTYGDGLSNVDIRSSLVFHKKHKKLATVTAVQAPSRFGNLIINKDKVTIFDEKPLLGDSFINGGFFCFVAKMLGINYE